MQPKNLLTASYFVALALVLFGAAQKITHAANAEGWLVAGFLAQLVFIVLAISNVWKTAGFTNSEKWMWTIALLFTSFIAGAAYLLSGRTKARRRVHASGR